jgi:hypothetical protein
MKQWVVILCGTASVLGSGTSASLAQAQTMSADFAAIDSAYNEDALPDEPPLPAVYGSTNQSFALLPLPSADTSRDTVVMKWNMLALRTVLKLSRPPTVTSRAMSMLNSAMYEAWTAYDQVAASPDHCTSLRRPAAEHTLANKQKAMSFAAYRVLTDLFASEAAAMSQQMATLGFDAADTSVDLTTASGIGNAVAAELLGWRHADGANQLGDLSPGAYSDYTGYAPVNSPTDVFDLDRWQPLFVPGTTVAQKWLMPQWRNITPFALTSSSQFLPAAPILSSASAKFTKQSKAILAISAALTDTHKAIAEFWADPGCQWCQAALFVSRRDRHSEDQDVKMMFAMHNASLDAVIAIWDAKVHYDSVRPITAVRELFAGQTVSAWGGPGQGTKQISGETFRTYVNTPPFGEYVSGHSGNSAASAEVLKRFTGSDTFAAYHPFAKGSSVTEPGTVPAQDLRLMWPTFTGAADEAGISRRYGGIHFKRGDLAGRRLGHKVGVQAYKKAKAYFAGTCQ